MKFVFQGEVFCASHAKARDAVSTCAAGAREGGGLTRKQYARAAAINPHSVNHR